VPVHAVMTAAGVASGGGAQSKGIADSVGSIASSIARAVGLGGLAHAAGGAAHAATATPAAAPAPEAVAAPAPQAEAAPTLEGTIRPTMFFAPPDFSGARPLPSTLHPVPYTLHPAPCTLHPVPYTLHLQLLLRRRSRRRCMGRRSRGAGRARRKGGGGGGLRCRWMVRRGGGQRASRSWRRCRRSCTGHHGTARLPPSPLYEDCCVDATSGRATVYRQESLFVVARSCTGHHGTARCLSNDFRLFEDSYVGATSCRFAVHILCHAPGTTAQQGATFFFQVTCVCTRSFTLMPQVAGLRYTYSKNCSS